MERSRFINVNLCVLIGAQSVYQTVPKGKMMCVYIESNSSWMKNIWVVGMFSIVLLIIFSRVLMPHWSLKCWRQQVRAYTQVCKCAPPTATDALNAFLRCPITYFLRWLQWPIGEIRDIPSQMISMQKELWRSFKFVMPQLRSAKNCVTTSSQTEFVIVLICLIILMLFIRIVVNAKAQDCRLHWKINYDRSCECGICKPTDPGELPSDALPTVYVF